MRGAHKERVLSRFHRVTSALRSKAPVLFVLGIVLLCIPVAAISTSSPSGAVRSIVLVECQVEEKPLLLFLLQPPKTKTNVPFSQFSPINPKPHFTTHSGTGFAVNGRIYTCEHVIHGGKNIFVTLRNGSKQPARLIRFDSRTDLAELKVEHPPVSLFMRRSAPGFFEKVWQIGNPGDMRFVTTNGWFLSFDGESNIFVIDTYFGNSGSPLLDRSGYVIGMTHAIIRGTPFTYGGTLQDLDNFIHPARAR
jgi:S1-C subfamily serine protease